MLSAPVCRQAGWLNAECKLKNAKSPSVKKVCKLESCKLESYNLFFKGLRYLIKPLERLHVRTLEMGIGNWEMGTGNFYFLFSVFYFLFPVSLSFFMHVYKVVS